MYCSRCGSPACGMGQGMRDSCSNPSCSQAGPRYDGSRWGEPPRQYASAPRPGPPAPAVELEQVVPVYLRSPPPHHPVNMDGHMTGPDMFLTGDRQELTGLHSPSDCEGRGCVIHHPSDHHMRLFPTHWRSDRGLMERVCPHGVGHPDPDDATFHISQGREYMTVHGCDGCCSPPNKEET